MDVIDLRSDTVTKPSEAMRAAMARADVGDDQYGEDPTVNLLQERIASLLGKEAALFVPSGTMANQIGLRLLTRPGDEVVVGAEAHMVWHEAGASAANAGVQFTVAGQGGAFKEQDFRTAFKPAGHFVFPPTTLVAIENTHNRGGGVVFPQEDVVAICAAARSLGAASYLDGARLFNVAVASNLSLAELAAPFDVVSVALSKGLGCPAGSLIAGTAAAMRGAVRVRRMLGGAMRQSGILAAAGLYALDQGIDAPRRRPRERARYRGPHRSDRRGDRQGDRADQHRDLQAARPLPGRRNRGAARQGARRSCARLRATNGARHHPSECQRGAMPARGRDPRVSPYPHIKSC